MKNAKRVFPLEKAEGTAYGDGFRWGSLRIVAGAEVVVGRGWGGHTATRGEAGKVSWDYVVD